MAALEVVCEVCGAGEGLYCNLEGTDEDDCFGRFHKERINKATKQARLKNLARKRGASDVES